MRTYRVINRNHPHNRLKFFLETQKKQYRQYFDTPALRKLAAQRAPACAIDLPHMWRHKVVELLLECDAADFKRRWMEVYSFPFEDVYDESKFAKHIEEAKAQNAKPTPITESTAYVSTQPQEASSTAR
jgi:hypothetical protein